MKRFNKSGSIEVFCYLITALLVADIAKYQLNLFLETKRQKAKHLVELQQKLEREKPYWTQLKVRLEKEEGLST